MHARKLPDYGIDAYDACAEAAGYCKLTKNPGHSYYNLKLTYTTDRSQNPSPDIIVYSHSDRVGKTRPAIRVQAMVYDPSVSRLVAEDRERMGQRSD